MSLTRILCDKCGFPLVYCQCKKTDSYKGIGIRFLTVEEAEAYLFGTNPTRPLYNGDPGWEDAPFEIGLMIDPWIVNKQT